MFARLSKFKDQVVSNVSYAWSEAQTIGSYVAYGAKTLYHSEAFREDMVQGMQGFTQSWSPSLIIVNMRSADTRLETWHSFQSNIIYFAGPALLYEAGLKSILHAIYGENTWLESGLDVAAYLYLWRISNSRIVDNRIYAQAIAQAVTRDMPDDSRIKSCECDPIAKIQADLLSPIYYNANLATSYAISRLVPYVGSFVALPFKSLAYGQGLLAYKLSEIGLCHPHREDLLQKNNAYALGLGLSFLGALKSWELLLNYSLGVSNSFVTEAIFYTLYQHYIVTTLLIDKPLPGKTPGRNYFHYNQVVADKLMQQLTEDVLPALFGGKPEQDFFAAFNAYLEKPVVQILLHILVQKDFHKIDSLLQRNEIKLLFKTNRLLLEGIYTKVSEIRKDKIKSMALYMPLPKSVLSDKARTILTTIKGKDALPFLQNFNDMLNYIYPDRDQKFVEIKALMERGQEHGEHFSEQQNDSEVSRVRSRFLNSASSQESGNLSKMRAALG